MECCLQLRCLQGQSGADPVELVIPLYQIHQQDDAASNDSIADMYLLEEGVYTCTAFFTQVGYHLISAELFLNKDSIGYGNRITYSLEKQGEEAKIDMVFQNNFEGTKEGRPFLLQYDLIHLSLRVQFVEGTGDRYVYYTSAYIPCLNRYSDNMESKEAIIRALLAFDDDKINDWMFPVKNNQADRPTAFLQGGWHKNSYKSLGSYVQMLESICKCYEKNYPSFKSNVKHAIAKRNSLQSYQKIRHITTDSLQWLFQNSEQLVSVSGTTAICLNGEYYLPYQMHIEKSIKSFDIYENQVVLGFLRLVYNHARYIEIQLRNNVETENKQIDKLQKMEHGGLRIPAIPVKCIQIHNSLSQLRILQELILNIEKKYPKYQEILRCFEIQFTGIPKKTKVFQEVQPYRHIFEQIMEWYRFGEFQLLKENVIFNIKTMDTLFEYYCLYKLLFMLQDAGFTESDDGEATSTYYLYRPTAYPYHCDIANTYRLQNASTRITLYYQPVIWSDGFENNITLYRTTALHDCYTPDFMFKIEQDKNYVCYMIMDAKYSTGETIRKYYMDKTILKYSCQVSGREKHPVKLVWLLQGRTDYSIRNNLEHTPIERYHSSPLAEEYKTHISYGIIPINNKTDMSKLWNEICRTIPELAGKAMPGHS